MVACARPSNLPPDDSHRRHSPSARRASATLLLAPLAAFTLLGLSGCTLFFDSDPGPAPDAVATDADDQDAGGDALPDLEQDADGGGGDLADAQLDFDGGDVSDAADGADTADDAADADTGDDAPDLAEDVADASDADLTDADVADADVADADVGDGDAADADGDPDSGDDVDPSLVSFTPTAMFVQSSGLVISATFDEDMDETTLQASFTVQNGGAVGGTVTFDTGSDVATFTPGGALTSAVSYTATVSGSATDLAGNPLTNPDSWTFTVDDDPPVIMATSPEDMDDDVDFGGLVVTATFDEDLDPATVNPSTFLVSVSGGAGVTGNVSFDAGSDTASFEPSAQLDPSTAYDVELTSGIADLAGNTLAGPVTFGFMTRSDDMTAPMIDTRTPSPGSTVQPGGLVVTVTFNEDVDIESLPGAMTLDDQAGPSITGDITPIGTGGTTTVTFTPNPPSQIGDDNDYDVTVSTAVTDLAGNALASADTWSFSTDGVAPTLQSSSPNDEDEIDASADPLTLTFSEPLAVATVDETSILLNDVTNGGTVNGSVAYTTGELDVTFTPVASLLAGNTYQLEATVAVTDEVGNPLQAGALVDFTTTPPPPLLIITEFQALGDPADEFVEIYNGGSTVDLQGFTLNGLAIDDPTETGLPVEIAMGEYLWGVSTNGLGSGEDFTYGNNLLNDGGDALTLSNGADITVSVNFSSFHTDLGAPVGATDFPGRIDASTQLDDAQLLDAVDGSDWCVTFLASDTRGAQNQPCGGIVINEFLYDWAGIFDGTTQSSDGNRVFVELAGPGGADITDWALRGVDPSGVANQDPDVENFPAGTRLPLDGYLVVADGTSDGGTTAVPNADIVLADGDPQNGPSDGLVLRDANEVVIDRVGYGGVAFAPHVEGTPIADLGLENMPISAGRDDNSTDSDDNGVDFTFYPTPNPGEPNLAVLPEVVAYAPDNGVASGGDFVTFDALSLGRHASGDFVVTFNGVPSDQPCELFNTALEGYGAITIICQTDVGTAGLDDIVLTNPADFGGGSQVSVADGWRYTIGNNETDSDPEADFCLLLTAAAAGTEGAASDVVEGQVFHSGITNTTDDSASIVAEVGYGPIGTDPRTTPTWTWEPSAFNRQGGTGNNDDIYSTTITVPAGGAGTYAMTYRFAVLIDDLSGNGADNTDGYQYTYCDTDGAGKNDVMLSFESGSLGTLTITAP